MKNSPSPPLRDPDPPDDNLQPLADTGRPQQRVLLDLGNRKHAREPVREDGRILGRATVRVDDALVEPGCAVLLHAQDEGEADGVELPC